MKVVVMKVVVSSALLTVPPRAEPVIIDTVGCLISTDVELLVSLLVNLVSLVA